MWYPMSISRSQLGQTLICGMEIDDALGESDFFGFADGAIRFLFGVTIAPTLDFGGAFASPKMLMTALSEMTVRWRTGILTAALHTGHLPVFPALDSFAVR